MGSAMECPIPRPQTTEVVNLSEALAVCTEVVLCISKYWGGSLSLVCQDGQYVPR
jgi:hypothetical protein